MVCPNVNAFKMWVKFHHAWKYRLNPEPSDKRVLAIQAVLIQLF